MCLSYRNGGETYLDRVGDQTNLVGVDRDGVDVICVSGCKGALASGLPEHF